MTDLSLVSNELKVLLAVGDEEVSQYEGLIEYAVNSVKPIIKDENFENDKRIVHLCAVKAYYQLALIQCDGMNSFSAGEVSFKMDTSFAQRAELLLKEAYSSCTDLIHNNDFAFEVV